MNWTSYQDSYRGGVYRDRVFHDMILDDARPAGKDLTVLDIGCGSGFDTDVPLQKAMARAAGTFVGIEPDADVTPGAYFHTVHRCLFEDAPIPPGSVDIAYAIMVLEHLARPQRFFDKVWQVLKLGGVFWALTVDSRHWFGAFSTWFDRLGIKDLYLNLFLGARGQQRYENYPTFYRCNSPAQVGPYVKRFRERDFCNLARVGQTNAAFPKLLHPLVNWWDRRSLRQNKQGSLLVVRLRK
jgi:SAM-dependent methyltransferase